MGKAVNKILKPVTSIFGMSETPSAPAPPPVAETVEMPIADDKASDAAAKRRVAAMKNRSGRNSTILTDAGGSGKLGG
jgi:hypothetical protein